MNKLLVLPFLAILSLPIAAVAEQVIIPVGQQSSENQAIEKPERGTSKDRVRAKFGEPSSMKPAVGEPPISSWEYPEFNVYFEYEHVLHSVLKRTEPGNTAAE
ncbi:hypothetical protein [Porticoccus sp.]|uniref:hypothetical protein n=1 Tax=Porticoccus sp. TaxID=2024853 RepID=UPI003F6A049F